MIRGTLIPAYGRDYKSKKAFVTDFDANKDFIVTFMGQSTYVNKEQFTQSQKIAIRYSSLRKVGIMEVKV